MLIAQSMSSCYFFRKSNNQIVEASESSGVLGESIGQTAGSVNVDLLNDLHATTSIHAPAAIRPDPDVFVRRLLLQYREEGSTVARQIGRVEQYRLLLGGANADFSVEPQKSFDATSLLANLKVAEEICTGLVAPNEADHPGWTSILPYAPSDSSQNLRFLAQRILGVPSAEIDSETITSLELILNASGGSLNHASYIQVCAALVIDARALLL